MLSIRLWAKILNALEVIAAVSFVHSRLTKLRSVDRFGTLGVVNWPTVTMFEFLPRIRTLAVVLTLRRSG